MEQSRVAIVTGAGSGIGRAVSLALLRAGYFVFLAGRRQSTLNDTRQLAGEFQQNALVVETDVRVEASVDHLFSLCQQHCGRIDILFNNAGMGAPAVGIDELALSDWKNVVDTNLTGMFLCAKAAMRLMKKQTPKGGRIINNGSISAHVPRPFSVAYTVTKHAVTGLTKAISLEGRSDRIACGQIDIGNAATDMTERMAQGILQADGSIREEARMDVNHVADAVVHMSELPLDSNIQFMTIMATTMPYIGRG